MKKQKLNSEALLQEFQEGSVFFRQNTSPPPEPAAPPEPSAQETASKGDTTVSRHHDTTTPSATATVKERPKTEPKKTASKGDTTVSRYHDTTARTQSDEDAKESTSSTPPEAPDPVLNRIRRAVKHLGKEAATHRFTEDEKRSLKKIEHEYALRGVRTSENELTRIAINYMVEDFKAKGIDSIFARVLKLLYS